MLGKRGKKPGQTKPVGTEKSDSPSHTTYKIDHAVVSSGGRNGFAWKQAALVGVTVLGVGVIIGFVLRNRNRSEPVSDAPKCSEQQLRKAAAEIDPSRSEYLKPVFDKIINTAGYAQDPNCMYVVVNYYINISDAEQASKALSQLEKVYDPEVGYDRNLGKETKPPADLKSSVDFLNEQAERYEDIDFSTGAPPQ